MYIYLYLLYIYISGVGKKLRTGNCVKFREIHRTGWLYAPCIDRSVHVRARCDNCHSLQEKILPSRSAVNCLDLSSTRNGDCNTERVAEISEIDWRVASGSRRSRNPVPVGR